MSCSGETGFSFYLNQRFRILNNRQFFLCNLGLDSVGAQFVLLCVNSVCVCVSYYGGCKCVCECLCVCVCMNDCMIICASVHMVVCENV